MKTCENNKEIIKRGETVEIAEKKLEEYQGQNVKQDPFKEVK